MLSCSHTEMDSLITLLAADEPVPPTWLALYNSQMPLALRVPTMKILFETGQKELQELERQPDALLLATIAQADCAFVLAYDMQSCEKDMNDYKIFALPALLFSENQLLSPDERLTLYARELFFILFTNLNPAAVYEAWRQAEVKWLVKKISPRNGGTMIRYGMIVGLFFGQLSRRYQDIHFLDHFRFNLSSTAPFFKDTKGPIESPQIAQYCKLVRVEHDLLNLFRTRSTSTVDYIKARAGVLINALYTIAADEEKTKGLQNSQSILLLPFGMSACLLEAQTKCLEMMLCPGSDVMVSFREPLAEAEVFFCYWRLCPKERQQWYHKGIETLLQTIDSAYEGLLHGEARLALAEFEMACVNKCCNGILVESVAQRVQKHLHSGVYTAAWQSPIFGAFLDRLLCVSRIKIFVQEAESQGCQCKNVLKIADWIRENIPVDHDFNTELIGRISFWNRLVT